METLSDKRQGMSNQYGYSDEDVKKFIKQLKSILDDDVDAREKYISKEHNNLKMEKKDE